MRIEGSVSSIGRQAFLKMNWKCLLVGLVLVFPGTLVSVEGRYYSQENRAVSEQDGFLTNLFNLFQQEQQRRLERYYGSQDDAVPAEQKRLGNNNNNNNNNKQADNSVVQRPNKDTAAIENGADTAAAAAATAPIEEAAGKATSQGGKVKQEGINMAAQPQAMRQELSRQGASSSKVVPSNTVFIMVVTGCTVLAAVAIVGAGVCWYKYHKSAKAASVVDYPAYGVTGPTKDRAPSPGDRKLAHSAQMYHYQHQKQQMMALQSASSGEMKHDGSDDESVEDNDDADYTVYECPGLAPTGEMEVKNPLFRGDETPSTPANDDTRPAPTEY